MLSFLQFSLLDEDKKSRQAAYRERHREELRAKQARYQETHHEFRDNEKEYRRTDAYREKRAKKKAEKKSKRERDARYRESHRETLRDKAREYMRGRKVKEKAGSSGCEHEWLRWGSKRICLKCKKEEVYAKSLEPVS